MQLPSWFRLLTGLIHTEANILDDPSDCLQARSVTRNNLNSKAPEISIARSQTAPTVFQAVQQAQGLTIFTM